MKDRIIFAMPSLCDSTDFGLSDYQVNRRMLRDLMKRSTLKPILERSNDGIDATLYNVGSITDGYYFMLEDDLIVYLMKYKRSNKKLLGVPSVTQTAVWRSLEALNVTGLVDDVIFHILLPRFGTIMSDALQTERGMELWHSLIYKSMRKSKTVALADFNLNRVVQFTLPAEFRLWVTGNRDFPWAERSQKHQGIRFIISNKKLDKSIPAISDVLNDEGTAFSEDDVKVSIDR